ncbi:phosphopantetheine-binding protein [Actinoplanes sp. NPDC023936]|uniref:acyl carrier protein n=1 Tax=Actinoplanes sp. NPDC023936 TaxID=3154910 RepID=UPI0033CB7E56
MNDQFEQVLRPHLPYLGTDQPLPPDARLQELGLDSMQAVELLFDIEESFDVTLPDDRLTADTFATPTSLFAVVEAEREAVS